MINFYKNLYEIKNSINKIILIILLLMSPTTTSAEIFSKNWNLHCNEKKACVIGVKNEFINSNTKKKQDLATVFIYLSSKTERKMDLVDGEEKTYKLSEKKKIIPTLLARLPLSISLENSPLIQIDNKNITNLKFTHCNTQFGCTATIPINDNIINLFRSGKLLKIILRKNGGTKNFAIEFPLKGFSKSYKNLINN